MGKFKFSQFSLDRLEGVHPKLVMIVSEVMAMGVMDFRVVEGVRTVSRQKELVAAGKSKTMLSKHLVQRDGFGHAVDLFPYPVDMEKVNKGDSREISRFGVLAGLVKAVAFSHNVKVTWGADWDGDGETLDHTFFDGPHFQIELDEV